MRRGRAGAQAGGCGPAAALNSATLARLGLRNVVVLLARQPGPKQLTDTNNNKTAPRLWLRDVVVLLARHAPEQAVHRRQQLVAGGDGLFLAPAGWAARTDTMQHSVWIEGG